MTHGQWVLEYNTVPLPPMSVFQASYRRAAFKAHSSRHPRPIRQASLDDWHEMMGHLYPEALHKMSQSCQGVSITTSKLSNHKCEDCCLNYAKRVPYRFPTKRHTQPFGKVYWDLIVMKNGIGGENQILHFFDSCTCSHYVYHLYGKGEMHVLPAFQHFTNYAERRWGHKVMIFHGDGETAVSFGSSFEAWIVECGFIMEKSPPHTQDQNGPAERSGGVLIRRARAMKNTINLLEILWPKFLTCVAYLLNRSPTKSLNWETLMGYLERLLGN
jgi:hypothetical protein